MYPFRMKLMVIMIVFAMIISFTSTIIDYNRLKEEVVNNNQLQIQQIEYTIENALKSIEKAYYLFDKETALKMETDTKYLIDLYENTASFDEWDFKTLKDRLGVDIYIINDQNVITNSSFESDIGLDFSVCCQKLAKILDERRDSGEFFSDGIDIEQQTGSIKKYSYMATPDKKFIIELGFSLQNGIIFKEFNFLKTIDELEQKYSTINEINVLNLGGYSLGKTVEEARLSRERREMFNQALATKQTTELTSAVRDEPVIYRYVPYISELDKGSTQYKVIEIAYNQKELQSILKKNNQAFIIQIVIALLATVIISMILSRWLSRPMYLAFHDSLTGLKNRAAFSDLFQKKLEENKGTMALMIMDLDNFKLVNDHLGHDAGDELLRSVAKRLQSSVRNTDMVFRLGGDEFVIIVSCTDKKEVEIIAERVIGSIESVGGQLGMLKGKVTASIGVSLVPEHGCDLEKLYKKADLALYTSKEKGKNQFYIYSSKESRLKIEEQS